MRALNLAALALALTAPATASAGEALSLELTPNAQQGQGQPQLLIKAHSALTRVTLDVKRSTDGRRVKDRAGPILAGRNHAFDLPMKAVGQARFVGSLSVQTEDGQTGSMPIDVQVELLAPLKVMVHPEDLDRVNHVLKLSASRPVVKAQVTLMSDNGAPMGTTEAALGPPDAEGHYQLQYSQEPGTVMKMVLQVYDDNGFFGGVDLFPWQVDIPHQEVNFSSGAHEIEAGEVPKLEGSLEHIRAAIRKYGKLADISLFIAGHTDTVGDGAANQGLSERRARAIAQWFNRQGVKIPVHSAGFGETLLLVETPDETDEGRNRRAEYIVAVSPPRLGGREVKWQRVR